MAKAAPATVFRGGVAGPRGAGAPPALPSLVKPPEPNRDTGPAERTDIAELARSRTMLEAFVDAVERLGGVVDQETQMLGLNKPIALNDFNHRKSHGLLELSRAMIACRGIDRSAFDVGTRAPLERLRAKLESNLASLQTHLTAVGEIAAVIARAIEDHESDGTYTARRAVRGDEG